MNTTPVVSPPIPPHTPIGPTTFDIRVHSPETLVSTLRSHSTGSVRVIIPSNARWDLSGFASIPLRSGISLIGERGPMGSRPILFTTNKAEHHLFEITGNDVRVEGIHFRGPAAGDRRSGPYVDAIQIIEDPVNKLGRRVLVTNNEFDEWTGSGVGVLSTQPKPHLEDYPADVAPITKEEAGLVRIERNYIHHNTMDEGGYGVGVGKGAYATIEGNVFDFNRHAVASDGYAHSGYVARFNYVLQGGFKQGGFYNQHFDVHGTVFVGSENTGYGGSAGEYYEIAYNTIRGDQKYYLVKTRPAFMLRGRPTKGAYFNYNITVHDNLDAAVSLKEKKGVDTGIGEDHSKFNFHASGNRFNTDYSTELATGDFDGDGRADVFVANGTAWFFSRAAIGPWEFLHASNKRTSELGFADIDNDRVTDVLYRDSSGNLGYLKGGAHPLAPLTTAPVPMKDLRFGDFDGDSKTDIFYTQGGQWYIWYGRTRAWTTAQTSSIPISELLFGEFDDVRGTDVVAVTSGIWAYSSAGTGSWAKLNNQLTRSLANAVAADFDGNGKSDIAFIEGGKWRYSRDGRFPLAILRESRLDDVYVYVSLRELLVGPFEGGKRAKVVRFEMSGPPLPILGERLEIWRGPGSGSAFTRRSLQNMR